MNKTLKTFIVFIMSSAFMVGIAFLTDGYGVNEAVTGLSIMFIPPVILTILFATKDQVTLDENDLEQNHELSTDGIQSGLENEMLNKENHDSSLSKDEATKMLKEFKEQLDLELITQEEYDQKKEELSPFILNPSEQTSNRTKSDIPSDTLEFINSIKENLEDSQDSKIGSGSGSLSFFKTILFGGVLVFFIFGLITLLNDPTRCNNGGCDYRKNGYYLMKDFPQMGAGHYSNQSNFSWSKHAYRKKEFCSKRCGNDYYRKL